MGDEITPRTLVIPYYHERSHGAETDYIIPHFGTLFSDIDPLHKNDEIG